jgi:chromosome transmission fidelity protein 4
MDISGDKLVRATELVKLLSLEKSMKGAIKLVTALKLPNLAEKFNDILEVSPLCINNLVRYRKVIISLSSLPCNSLCLKQERLYNEVKKTTDTNLKENSSAPITSDTLPSSSKAKTSKASIISSSPNLSAPSFIKKNKTQEAAKDGMNKPAIVNGSKKSGGDETSDKKGKEAMQAPPHPLGSSVKSTNKPGVDKSEPSLVTPTRPSNPFLKSSMK